MKGGQKSVLVFMNVYVKCKASVTAALRGRCSPIVEEVGKIRQSQILLGLFFFFSSLNNECLFFKMKF